MLWAGRASVKNPRLTSACVISANTCRHGRKLAWRSPQPTKHAWHPCPQHDAPGRPQPDAAAADAADGEHGHAVPTHEPVWIVTMGMRRWRVRACRSHLLTCLDGLQMHALCMTDSVNYAFPHTYTGTHARTHVCVVPKPPSLYAS